MANNPQRICHGCGRIHRGLSALCCYCVHECRPMRVGFEKKDRLFRTKRELVKPAAVVHKSIEIAASGNCPLTTTQAAEVLEVSPNTVKMLCDSGHLRYYKIPGSKHRRIMPDAIQEMLRHKRKTEKIAAQIEKRIARKENLNAARSAMKVKARECPKCGTESPSSEYLQRKSKRWGFSYPHGNCRECRAKYARKMGYRHRINLACASLFTFDPRDILKEHGDRINPNKILWCRDVDHECSREFRRFFNRLIDEALGVKFRKKKQSGHGEVRYYIAHCRLCGEKKKCRNRICAECALRKLQEDVVMFTLPVCHTRFVKAGRYGPHDDTSPGWDNMIRCIEDFDY